MYVCDYKVQFRIAKCRAPRYAQHCLHTCYSLAGSVDPPIGHSPSGQTLYAYLRFRQLFWVATSGQLRRWTCFNSFFPTFFSLSYNCRWHLCNTIAVERIECGVFMTFFFTVVICRRTPADGTFPLRNTTRTASIGMAHYTHLRKWPHTHTHTHWHWHPNRRCT